MAAVRPRARAAWDDDQPPRAGRWGGARAGAAAARPVRLQAPSLRAGLGDRMGARRAGARSCSREATQATTPAGSRSASRSCSGSWAALPSSPGPIRTVRRRAVPAGTGSSAAARDLVPLAPLALGVRAVIVPGHVMSAAVAGGRRHRLSRPVSAREAARLGPDRRRAPALRGLGQTWTAARLSTDLPRWNEIELATLFPIVVLSIIAAISMHFLAFEDMTLELRQTNRRLEKAQGDLRQMVITDPLTGCYNRRFFDTVIARELKRHADMRSRCRCSSSTSTASRRSTTRSVTTQATGC